MYQKMYYRLFNAVTDAIQLLEQGEFHSAHLLLVKAQQAAEETYISAASDAEPVQAAQGE